MTTGKAILVVGGLGVGGYLLWQAFSHANALPQAPLNPQVGPGGTSTSSPSQDTFKANSLDPNNPIFAVPGTRLAYGVLQPIATHVLDPILKGVNSSTPVKAINQGVFGGTQIVTTTQNANGTITRTATGGNWYDKNVGEPISRGATDVIHSIASIF